MVLLGFEVSKSITLAKCFLETQPWKCMECTALLAGQNAHCCSICQSQNLTSPAWRSLTSHWIEWGPLWHCPTVWLKAGGAMGLVWCLNPHGLDKDTWPVWCGVYLYVNASMLQLWEMYKAQFKLLRAPTIELHIQYYLLYPSASIQQNQMLRNLVLVIILQIKNCLRNYAYGQSNTKSS